MIVSDIKKQKKGNRSSIYVDGKYAFSLSDWQMSASEIRVGMKISKEDLRKYSKKSDTGKIHDRALLWLSLRRRSEWEIDEYLKRKTTDNLIRDDIKDKITDLGLVDDEKFADSWVASRRSLKMVSRRRLTQELRQKRVSSEIIQKVLAADETSDFETVLEIVEKKRRQSKYQDQDKLMAYLARQGFNYQDIKRALTQSAEK